jgi:hypothetical protein
VGIGSIVQNKIKNGNYPDWSYHRGQAHDGQQLLTLRPSTGIKNDQEWRENNR